MLSKQAVDFTWFGSKLTPQVTIIVPSQPSNGLLEKRVSAPSRPSAAHRKNATILEQA
jgi:hypothetical protein